MKRLADLIFVQFCLCVTFISAAVRVGFKAWQLKAEELNIRASLFSVIDSPW